jgi:Tfp pilus assembly protein PilZ
VGKSVNRRRSKRQKRRLRVRFWSGEIEASGFTADVSNTGLFLVTSQPLEIETRLHLEIEIGGQSYFAEGVVVRRKAYPQYAQSMYRSGVGVRLVGLNEAIEHLGAEQEVAGEQEVPVQEAAADQPLGPDEEPDPDEELDDTKILEDDVPDGPMLVDLRDPEELGAVYERDIKHGGLLVTTRERPDVGSEVVVPVLLPKPHGQIQCSATVVKLKDSPPRIALLLRDVDQVRARLLEIIRGE